MDRQAEDAAVKAAKDIIRILDKMQASIRQLGENNKKLRETLKPREYPKATIISVEEKNP